MTDWLELTLEVMRDRSHASWKFLDDEELLTALAARRAVAAYLPGAALATRDLVLLRLAVSPEGRVALLDGAGAPVPGPPVEEFVEELLAELRTCAAVGPEELVGPPWLPVPEIVEAARRPEEDSRVVYAYRGDDTVLAAAFARDLGMPLTAHRVDGWVVVATGFGPERVLAGPPRRFTGGYPFAVLDRRGERRVFLWAASAKESDLRVAVDHQPRLVPAPPDGADAAAVDLAAWLADPAADPAEAPERPEGMTDEQHRVLLGWRGAHRVGTDFLREVSAAFGLPPVAAELVESRPGDPQPEGGTVLRPAATGTQFVAEAMAGLDDEEPTGRTPWAALERLLWRHPGAAVGLGVLELLVAALLAVSVLAGDGHWWRWVLVAVFALGGLAHLVEAVLRIRRRGGARPG